MRQVPTSATWILISTGWSQDCMKSDSSSVPPTGRTR